jgi:predicted O-methyltransferase YrrM
MLQKFSSEGIGLDYRLIEDSTDGYSVSFSNSIDNIEDNSIDICLVDGGPRGLCALKSIPKIKTGGILVIDNVNWFLPSETKSPSSVRTESEVAVEFRGVYEIIRSWRYVWTSNGVTDTAFYFKP